MAEVAAARGAEAAMRLDRFLWFARLAPTRAAAQGIATGGHLRIDGRPVERAHCPVRVGNVLTFAAFGRVRVVRIDTLPSRRGPAPEARACYADLTDPAAGPPSAPPPYANVSQQAPRD